jgi:hypothetical protein
MEAMGATAVDLRRPRARAGDLVVLPGNNSSVGEVPARYIARIEDVEIDTGAWCSTMSREAGAGFYSSGYGPLPFSLGKAPPERYRIVTLAR